jgi:hypothetical protein
MENGERKVGSRVNHYRLEFACTRRIPSVRNLFVPLLRYV